MENLIGDDIARIPDLASDPNTAIHLYGKAETRAGRKMGHVNRILAATDLIFSATNALSPAN